ncbi:unnamed protein product [Acanthocheilonema viteae]|uniref:Uncharacterized protein n=1 Tax=Acanthocheilonema viteae TaxID=6277 RepID=A0A498S908_ACAVI|nr:unnamed protein product [Acanthocheilonema viteae]
MRGCVNRFLLFGLDEDVRDVLTDKSECRTTDRRLFHLVALTPQTDLLSAAPTQPATVTTVPQENKKMEEDKKKAEEEMKKIGGKKDEEQKKEEKKNNEKEDKKKSEEEKENRQTEKKEKTEKVEGNREEGRQVGENPIVTPVSDEDEILPEAEKKGRGLAVNATQEENKEV